MIKIFNYNFLKKFIGGYIEIKFPSCFRLLSKHRIGIKYIFSGGTAALSNLIVLFLFTDIFHIWYITSVIIAFIVSLIASFCLQKFWTFRDNSTKRIKKQFAIYIVLGGINFLLDPAMLFVLVEYFHLWYLFGQVLVMGVLAIANYSINKSFTFKKDITHESVNV